MFSYSLDASFIVVLHSPNRLHDLCEFGDTTASSIDLSELRKGVEVLGDISHDRALIRLGDVANILDIQQLRDSQVLGGHIKGELSVGMSVRLVQRVEIQQIGAVAMN